MKKWNLSLLNGTDIDSFSGKFGTEENTNDHPQGSFSGHTTIILGAPGKTIANQIEGTSATWKIPTKISDILDYERGYLVTSRKKRTFLIGTCKYEARFSKFFLF